MKRLTLFFGILLSALAVNAQSSQQQPTAEQRAHNQALRMKKVVNLSDDQTVKVEEVFLTQDQALEKIKADQTLSPEERDKQIAQVKSERETKLQAILTPEQYEAYKQQRKEIQARRAAEGGH